MSRKIPTCKIHADVNMLNALIKFGFAYVMRKKRRYTGVCALMMCRKYLALVNVKEIQDVHLSNDLLEATKKYFKFAGYDSWEDWYNEVRRKNPSLVNLMLYYVEVIEWF